MLFVKSSYFGIGSIIAFFKSFSLFLGSSISFFLISLAHIRSVPAAFLFLVLFIHSTTFSWDGICSVFLETVSIYISSFSSTCISSSYRSLKYFIQSFSSITRTLFLTFLLIKKLHESPVLFLFSFFCIIYFPLFLLIDKFPYLLAALFVASLIVFSSFCFL